MALRTRTAYGFLTPYLPVFDLSLGPAAIKAAFAALSLDNFRLLLSDSLYLASYLRSLMVAGVSTAILLLIGYPMAYAMARLPQRWQSLAMMLVIVPFWTSLLVRTTAWYVLLQPSGVINSLLVGLGLVSHPLPLLFNRTGVLIGMTEAMAGLLFTPSAKSMFAFAILVLVLLFRPQGILGKRAS